MPKPTTRVEYALVRAYAVGPPAVAAGPFPENRWNDTITLPEAAARWYPGTVVARRAVTSYEDTVTDWTVLGEGAADEWQPQAAHAGLSPEQPPAAPAHPDTTTDDPTHLGEHPHLPPCTTGGRHLLTNTGRCARCGATAP